MKEILPAGQNLATYLRAHGVSPTAQRMQIAELLFRESAHFSAEDIYLAVNRSEQVVSKATVYNTLGLLVEKGLIKEVLVDPSKVFYDSNTTPHHHFYDVDSGEIEDIEGEQVLVDRLPKLPSGKRLDSVEVLIRVRRETS